MREKSENYTLRLPVELRKKLQKKADEDGRSLANYIVYILKCWVKDHEQK